ncbi:MAG: hypothetical protein V1754_13085 [Pseudomonadota bacterium]
MAYYCHKCRNELEFIVKVGIKVGRADTCIHCTANLHACKNCRFYDPGLHNQCRIPDADFIRDREEANFCAQFEFRDQDEPPEQDDSVQKARAKLDNLFKGLK